MSEDKSFFIPNSVVGQNMGQNDVNLDASGDEKHDKKRPNDHDDLNKAEEGEIEEVRTPKRSISTEGVEEATKALNPKQVEEQQNNLISLENDQEGFVFVERNTDRSNEDVEMISDHERQDEKPSNPDDSTSGDEGKMEDGSEKDSHTEKGELTKPLNLERVEEKEKKEEKKEEEKKEEEKKEEKKEEEKKEEEKKEKMKEEEKEKKEKEKKEKEKKEKEKKEEEKKEEEKKEKEKMKEEEKKEEKMKEEEKKEKEKKEKEKKEKEKKEEKQMEWEKEKAKCLNASLDERRKRKINCKELSSIETWPEYYKKYFKTDAKPEFPDLSEKVSIWKGDITSLLIDAIVNAANEKLLGGGGVDGVIHSAAQSYLKEECRKFGGRSAGESVITGGYQLPAKYVIHTVGPRGEIPEKLESCYWSSLELLVENGQKSIAFPCISTGIFGYPNDKAAEVVLKTVRKWLENNHEKVDRVIFCLFLEKDIEIYKNKMQEYFPMISEGNQSPEERDPELPNQSSVLQFFRNLPTKISNFFSRIFTFLFYIVFP